MNYLVNECANFRTFTLLEIIKVIGNPQNAFCYTNCSQFVIIKAFLFYNADFLTTNSDFIWYYHL